MSRFIVLKSFKGTGYCQGVSELYLSTPFSREQTEKSVSFVDNIKNRSLKETGCLNIGGVAKLTKFVCSCSLRPTMLELHFERDIPCIEVQKS